MSNSAAVRAETSSTSQPTSAPIDVNQLHGSILQDLYALNTGNGLRLSPFAATKEGSELFDDAFHLNGHDSSSWLFGISIGDTRSIDHSITKAIDSLQRSQNQQQLFRHDALANSIGGIASISPLFSSKLETALYVESRPMSSARSYVERTVPSIRRSFVQPMNDGISNSIVSHLVSTDEDGNLQGQLTRFIARERSTSQLTGTRVFLVRNSLVVRSAVLGSDGQFQLEDVPSGDYAICAAGPNGFLAYGVHVADWDSDLRRAEDLPNPDGAGDPSLDEDSDWQLIGAVVPPQFRTLERVMSAYLPNEVTDGSDDEDEEPEDGEIELQVEEGVVEEDFNVILTEDGQLIGRMSPLTTRRDKPARLREMNAFLIQDDAIYARVPVEEDGSFSFFDVEPGIYSFAASGEEGCAALSFNAVEPSEDISSLMRDPVTGEQFHFVGTGPAPFVPALEVALAPVSESQFLLEMIGGLVSSSGSTSGGLGASNAASLGGGGGGGGGGGAGGGLGFAGEGVLGLTGLALAGGTGLGGGTGGSGFVSTSSGGFPQDFNQGSGGGGPGGGDGSGGGGNAPIPEPMSVVLWSILAALALGGHVTIRRFRSSTTSSQ